MKKLSLLLAFVLVISCVLVACGDETETSSTPATESSVAADASSEAATEESSEAATEESSEAATESSEATEESSEAEESSEPEESSKVEIGELGEVISTGKSYTTTAPNRNDSFDDDGVRLTNGVKNPDDPGTTESAGWNSPDKTIGNTVEVIVDLGEAKESNAYAVYLAGGNWGIGIPNDFDATSLEVFASDSADGEFVSVASAASSDMVLVTGSGVADDTWSTFSLTAGAAETVNARYIKFVITVLPIGNSFVWMNEVEVFAPAA
ncbi:MAG: hypothetical protein IKU30_04015 [Clostridia bacterium]|nr:hypothetical protein [Clostridia bacterium]